ncbi:discoidin domain-containing protein [Paenibacillus polymyxa]|uniref:discoidin domain-containing protein n=1 Tax=Paenibacillus polymyxa TaxID=1406 RepID=UPI0008FBA88C|nr:discoidin domain-containing protein [Paenibacillus polymyxa]
MQFLKKVSILFGMFLFGALALFHSSMYAASEPGSSKGVTNLIPKMTSNTAPSGEASASSTWSSGHQAYNAFDHTAEGIGWATKDGVPYGWLGYEFEKPVAINTYTLEPRKSYTESGTESPKVWTFEGWDGANWVMLDTKKNITDWKQGVKKVFTFNNDKAYKKYRLNITENNGRPYYVTLGEMEMMYDPSIVAPEPKPEDPTVPGPKPEDPNPTPVPAGDRAILVVTMTTGLEKEFDLSMKEVNDFIAWYDAKDAGRGQSFYKIDKHDNNKGPFSSRKDYMLYDRILTFEVSEYSK